MTDPASHSLANESLGRFYDDIGFSGVVGFGKRPALAVIDLARAWVDPNSPIGSANLAPVVDNTVVLLDEARRRELPIFFTVMSYASDLSDVGSNVLAKSRHLRLLVRDSEWTELDPRLGHRAGEPLIHKQRASAFFGTAFLSLLVAREVDTLILVGCSTSGCIRATAEAAFDNNLRTIVVADAVGDRSPSAHEANLFDINARYADVVTMDQVLAHLRVMGDPL